MQNPIALSQPTQSHPVERALDCACDRGLIDSSQLQPLKAFLLETLAAPKPIESSAAVAAADASTAAFSFAHVLYYFGGLIAISAMSIFATLGFDAMGYGFLCVVSVGYAVLALALTEWFLQRKLTIPAGIMAALAVTMVPLLVYSMQRLSGFWSESYGADSYRDFHVYIDWRWIIMELTTLAAGAIALWRYRLPFLMMPVALVGWYFSMDIARFFAATPDSWDYYRPASIVVGLVMVIASLLLDKRTLRRPDLGFWLCLFGALSFWGAISWSDSQIWWHKHAYALLSVLMIFAGALLNRRIFTVLGALSFAGYLGWLSFDVFQDSLLFPFALCAIGLGVVFFGVWWQRNELRIAGALRGFVVNDVRREN
jgi:hypothetical protein